MKIVIIYLGGKIPSYVTDNIIHINNNLTKDIVFISDNPISLKKVDKIGVETWQCKNSDIAWANVKKSMSHSMSFRNGFWFKTVARFFAIHEYLIVNKAESVLQVEADVILAQDFPINKFAALNVDLAFPLESPKRGIASLLFIGSTSAAQKLVDFTISQITENNHSTDMTILGNVIGQKNINTIILPTLTRQMIIHQNRWKSNLLQPMAKNFDKFGGIFDGISFGLFLTGQDPRNNKGKSLLFQNAPTHSIDASKFDFVLTEQNKMGIKVNSTLIPLFNLHVHSKNRNLFKEEKRYVKLNDLLKLSRGGPASHRVWKVTFIVILRAAVRKLIKNEK